MKKKAKINATFIQHTLSYRGLKHIKGGVPPPKLTNESDEDNNI